MLTSWLDHRFHLKSKDLILVTLVFICAHPVFRIAILVDNSVLPLPFLLLALQEETQRRRPQMTGFLL
ncbi:MAG: hypothetical protein C4K49_12925 [Candidatus Thorarchaeota archaeon]|nr:MAG: hypothetical protein C4K49_12925 [Candidatus Thorarchaeota archaeon]